MPDLVTTLTVAPGLRPCSALEEIGLDFEFADGLDAGAERDGDGEALVVVDAIDEEVVGAFAVAVGEELAAGALVIRAGAGHDGAAGAKADAGDAGAQGGELHEVAAVQRQFRNLPLLDDLADRGVFTFYQRRGARYGDGFRDVAQLQLKVEAEHGVDFERDVFLLEGFEAALCRW